MKTDDKVGSRAQNTGRKLASNLGQKESEGGGGGEGEGEGEEGREREKSGAANGICFEMTLHMSLWHKSQRDFLPKFC